MCPDLLDALLEPHREAEQLGGADSGFSLHVVLGFSWEQTLPSVQNQNFWRQSCV